MNSVRQQFHPSELWQGFWGIQILHAGQSLGLFNSLNVAKTVATLAQECGLEVRYANLWCEAATSFGLLEQIQDTYQTPPEFSEWLERSKGFTHTHLHLARRSNETLNAVFGGRALPEPQISLRLLLQESLQANYQWLFQETTKNCSELEDLFQRGGRVLELGCGVGFGLSYLRDYYPKLELYGVESDYECAQEAERSSRAVIHVGQLPMTNLTTGFDVIVCFRNLTAAKDPESLITECSRLLRPKGFLLLGSETTEDSPLRKSAARINGEKFIYNLLAGETLLNTFSNHDLQGLLTGSGFEISQSLVAPDWATPALVCRRI